MYIAKTKALISFAVTAKLICVFVFAYAKCWFSHDAAQIKNNIQHNFSIFQTGHKRWDKFIYIGAKAHVNLYSIAHLLETGIITVLEKFGDKQDSSARKTDHKDNEGPTCKSVLRTMIFSVDTNRSTSVLG